MLLKKPSTANLHLSGHPLRGLRGARKCRTNPQNLNARHATSAQGITNVDDMTSSKGSSVQEEDTARRFNWSSQWYPVIPTGVQQPTRRACFIDSRWLQNCHIANASV
eukprot:1158011-Pelagomonas_calceolata.AAC.3